MTKAEIINQIAKNTGIEKGIVSEVVENFMEEIKTAMLGGENIYLRGFGSFILKTRAEKVARNIKLNTSIVVPEHEIPAFKPAKEFATNVKNKKNN